MAGNDYEKINMQWDMSVIKEAPTRGIMQLIQYFSEIFSSKCFENAKSVKFFEIAKLIAMPSEFSKRFWE